MTKKKLFGQNRGAGVLGVSLLSYGLQKRTAQADPQVVIDLHGEKKPVRKVKLRKDPLPE